MCKCDECKKVQTCPTTEIHFLEEQLKLEKDRSDRLLNHVAEIIKILADK